MRNETIFWAVINNGEGKYEVTEVFRNIRPKKSVMKYLIGSFIVEQSRRTD